MGIFAISPLAIALAVLAVSCRRAGLRCSPRACLGLGLAYWGSRVGVRGWGWIRVWNKRLRICWLWLYGLDFSGFGSKYLCKSTLGPIKVPIQVLPGQDTYLRCCYLEEGFGRYLEEGFGLTGCG